MRTMTDDLVEILSTPSAVEGEIVRGRLEAEGIPVLVKGEAEGPYRLGPSTLFVPSSFEARARMVLGSIDEPPGEGDDEGVDER
jgi:hypothetical protein